MTPFNDEVPAILLSILAEHGVDLIRDPRTVRNLLADLTPEAELERHAIWISLEAGIVQELYDASKKGPRRPLEQRCIQRLHQIWGIREDVARWVVQSWYEILSDKSILLPRKPKPAAVQVTKAGVLQGHTNIITHITFSPSGKALASASADKTVRIWDVSTCTSMYTIDGHTESVLCVAFHPKREEIASASADKNIRIWDRRSNHSYVLSGHKMRVNTLAYSPPDGRLLASASYDKTVRFWLSSERKELFQWDDLKSGITDLAVSSDGRLIVMGSRGGDIYIGEIAGPTPSILKVLKGHNNQVSSVSFSPDRKLIASGAKDNTVRMWSLDNFTEVATLDHSGPVNAIAFSPHGPLLASATEDGKISFWDRNTHQNILRIDQDRAVNAIAFDPSGGRLATVSRGNDIQLWSVQLQTADN